MSRTERHAGDLDVEAAWLAVSDGLLRGVGHAMNNRVAALSAVLQVLTSTGEGGPLTEALTGESQRLLRTVELMRLLPRHWDAEAEPVLLEDIVRSSLELVPLHSDLPELHYVWEAEGDLPPVLAEPSLLLHAVCLLLTRVARAAVGGEGLGVKLRGSSSSTMVALTITTVGGRAGAEAPQEQGVDEPTTSRPILERLAKRVGGELVMLTDSEHGFGLEFQLPTLTEARRREREGRAPPGGR